MKNGMSLITKSKRPLKPDTFHNTEFGFSLNDFAPLKSVTESVQTYLQENVYDPVKAQAESLVGAETVAKLGDKIEAAVVKQGESLEVQLKEKATGALTEYAQQYVGQKEVQDNAIQTAFQATADKLAQAAINVKDTYREGGVKGLFDKYPVPFYVAGGVTTLLVLRFVLGGRKKVYVSAPNPRIKKKVTRRK